MPRRPEPRKAPRQARSRALVEAILTASSELLERDSVELRLSEVAERAGVSPGSLYQYYPSKEALLGALIDRQIELDRTAFAEWLPLLASSDGSQIAAVLVDGVLFLYGSRPRLFAGMLRALELVGRAEDVRSVVTELCVELSRLLAAPYPKASSEARRRAADTAVFAALGVVREVVLRAPDELREDELRRLLVAMTESTFSVLA